MSITTATGVQFAAGQPYYDKIITDHYEPTLADAQNNATVTASLIPNDERFIGGKNLVFPVKTTRNTGQNNVRTGSGLMPDPGNIGFDLYSFKARTWFGRILIDGTTIDFTNIEVDRWVDAIDVEWQGMLDTFAVEENRKLHNDGSGRFAEVASVSTVNITLRVNQDIESPATCTSVPTFLLRVGDRVAFIDAAAASPSQAAYIVSIAGSVIQVSATPGGSAIDIHTQIAAGYYVVRASNTDLTTPWTGQELSSGWKTEPMGLAGMFSDANVHDGTGRTTGQTGQDYYGTSAGSLSFQGIDATANAYNQCTVLDNAGVGRPITEAILQQAFSDAMRLNNADIDMAISSYETRDTYLDTLIVNKRFVNTIDLKGGSSVMARALEFNGIPWYVDRHCYRNRVYFMALKAAGFKRFIVKPLSVASGPGGEKWRWVQDQYKYVLALIAVHNYGVEVRQRLGAQVVDLLENR